MTDRQKQVFNPDQSLLENCHRQEKAAYLAHKELNFLFDDLLSDVDNLATMIENKIDSDLNTLKNKLTIRGLIKTFPKTTVALSLTSGFLIGKSLNGGSPTNLNYSSIEKSKSQDLLNEIKAVGVTFLTRYILNLVLDTLERATEKRRRSDPH